MKSSLLRQFALTSTLALALGHASFSQENPAPTAPEVKAPKFVTPPDVNGMKTVIAPTRSARPLKVAIFSGNGSPQSSVDVAAKAVGFVPNASFTILKGEDIGTTELKAYDVIVFPGGSGSAQSKTIGEAGLNNVREFVRGGGGYVGICAGAYLACTNYSWSLGILNAATVSPKWQRGHAILEEEGTDAATPVLGKVEGKFNVRYHNGPIIKPADRADLPAYTPLALFRTEVAEHGSPRRSHGECPRAGDRHLRQRPCVHLQSSSRKHAWSRKPDPARHRLGQWPESVTFASYGSPDE